MTALCDVIAVNLESNRIRVMATKKTDRNADAIVNLAVIRRGLGEEFFVVVDSGVYQDGDVWKGGKA